MARSYRAPVRAARAAASRRAILDAARQRFAREGYTATTLAAIADDAGVAVETVYKHFRSKSGLLQHLLADAFGADEDGVDPPSVGPSADQLARLTAAPDPVERLRLQCEYARDLYERTADLQRIVAEAAGTDDELARQWATNRGRRLETLEALVTSFEADGSLVCSPQDAVDVLWAVSSPQVYLAMVDERGWSPQRFGEWLFALLRRELLA
jgi:AcrR family transcriptional regulator